MLFSCFVLPCLFFPEAILARYKSLQGAGKSGCGSLRPRPSNQVVYQTLPGTRKTTAEAVFACFSKTTSQVWGLLGTSLHGWKEDLQIKGKKCRGYEPPWPMCYPLFHFFWRGPILRIKKIRSLQSFQAGDSKQTTCLSLAFPSKIIVVILANWHTLRAIQHLKTSSCGSQSWKCSRNLQES